MVIPNLRIFALLLALISGCVSVRPHQVAECESSGDAPLFSVVLPAGSDRNAAQFIPPEDGSFCVRVTKIDTSTNNQRKPKDVQITLGPASEIKALVGGSDVGLNISQRDWRGEELSFAVQAESRVEHTIKIATQDIDVLIEGLRQNFPDGGVLVVPGIPGFDIPGGRGGGGGSVSPMDIDVPDVGCDGRLLGFRHPMRFEEVQYSERGRPAVDRRIRMRCIAHWTIKYKSGAVYRRTTESGQFWSETSGEYVTVIPAGKITVEQGEDLQVKLERIEPVCGRKIICGREHWVDQIQQGLPMFRDDILNGSNQFSADVLDVLDLVAYGPQAANFNYLLGARLISNGLNHPERNDKPFIIHEQLDVHNEEHTEFFVWGLAGQPVRLRFNDVSNDGKERYSDPRQNPCDFGDQQLCLPFTEECSTATCSSEDRACLEYPMLQTLLENGYDIWIVDNLKGEGDITHTAAAAPLLYQKILNYGGPLGQSISPGVGVDTGAVVAESTSAANTFAVESNRQEQVEHFLRDLNAQKTILTADLANRFLNEIALPTGPVATDPVSGSRRAIVAGYSLGGVLAKIALRMWETRDAFGSDPHSVLKDQSDRQLHVVTQPSTFMEEPSEKIALYVSIDAPHQGARVPLSLQAYLHRFKFMLDKTGSAASAAEAIDRAITELTATPTRQLLQEEINPLYKYGSLGCFHPNDESISGCTVTPLEPDIKSRKFDVESTLFQARWNEVIDSLEPNSIHGLPATVPAVAVSNGAISGSRTVASREVAHIRWHIDGGVKDKHHALCDETEGDTFGLFCTGGKRKGSHGGDNYFAPRAGKQPGGSQWNNICRRVNGQTVGQDLGGCSSLAGCFNSIFTFKLKFKDLIAEILDADLKKISVDYRMRARFDNGAKLADTGFPTLVPTKSALFQDERSIVSPAWRDAQWQPNSEYHTNFDNEMCRMILFHADGAFDEDQDGWPRCDQASRVEDCRSGGRSAGSLLRAGGLLMNDEWCDCAPSNSEIYPGSGC